MDTVRLSSAAPQSQRPVPQSGAAPDAPTGATMTSDSFAPTAPQPEAKPKKSLQDKAVDAVVYREIGVNVFDFQPLSGGSLALDVRAKTLKPDDGILTGDANRMHTIAQMKAAGQSATWVELRGTLHPHIGASIGVPAGPVSFSPGAWADGELGVSILAPYVHEAKAAVQAGKNLTVDFPFTADNAKALREGSEGVLHGRGTLGAGVGVSLYQSGTALPFGYGVGVSVNASASTSKDLDLSLRIKRLDASRVQVTLSRVDSVGHSESLGASAGLNGSLQPGALPVDNKATNLATNFVEGQLRHWLNAEASVVYGSSDADKEITSFVMDLSKPDAAKAYEKLLRLDCQSAVDLAKQAGSGVKQAKLQESSESSSTSFHAKVGPITMLDDRSSTTLASGSLQSPRGDFEYHRATLDQSHEDIVTRWWKGARQTTRDYVETSRKSEMLPGSLYHVRNEARIDGNTPEDTMRRFMATASVLVGQDKVDAAMKADPDALTRYWSSRIVVDMAIKSDGVQRLFSASEKELQKAYADTYEELDRPWDNGSLFGMRDDGWKTTPWLATSDPHYREIVQLLEAGPEGGSSSDGNQTRDDRYRQITKRSLWQDSDAYKESKRLVSMVQGLAKSPNSKTRTEFLAKTSGLDLDPFREVGMLTRIAGQDNLALRELAVRDGSKAHKDLIFVQNGLIGDPREEIDQGLAFTPLKSAQAPQ